MKKINENTKVTLTLGQLKKLAGESKEWNSRWSAIDGHPDGGETETYFSGTCDCCLRSFGEEDRLSTLYEWFTNDSIRRDKEAWNRIKSMAAKLDDDADEEFMSELDQDYNDYCEDCAIDILEDLVKKYLDSMKKSNESQKVTLTLEQLKRLVKENEDATDSLKDVDKDTKKDKAAIKKVMDYVAGKIENALGIMGLEAGKTCELRVNYDAHTIVVRTVPVKNMKRLQQALIKTANLVDDDVRKADAYWIARDKPWRMGRYDVFEIERV